MSACSPRALAYSVTFAGCFWSGIVGAHDDPAPRAGATLFGLVQNREADGAAPLAPGGLRAVTRGESIFHTVSLAPLADTALTAPDEWAERIWKYQFQPLPRGAQIFAGIPFDVIPPKENRGRAALMLIGGRYHEGPAGGGRLDIGRPARALYVLHTASYQNCDAGRRTATYILHYADGETDEIPVRNLEEVADFMTARNLSADAVVGWKTQNPLFKNEYAVYVLKIRPRFPNRSIAAIEFRPSPGSAVVSVLGLTLADTDAPLEPLPGVDSLTRPPDFTGPTGTLQLELAAAGSPSALRVAVQDERGGFVLPPRGLNHSLFGKPLKYFYASGATSIDVPAGRIRVRGTQGFEFRPVERMVTVADGQTLEVRIDAPRWIDMPALGWYSGETHIHPFDQEPEDSSVIVRAEDLHVSNLLIWGNGFYHRLHSDQFFRGRPETWPDATHVAYYNEEFRNNTYGHLCLLELKELVFPLGTGAEYGREDYPANATIMERTHAQGGHVAVAHMSIPPVQYAVPWEVGVDVALGRVDSVDIDLRTLDRQKNRSLDLWYRLLNCGFVLPATCGTDSFLNMDWTNMPPGNLRTYAHVGETFSYSNWMSAARKGRSFITQGPMLFLTVNGKEPGSTLSLASSTNDVLVEARVLSQFPLRQLELVLNGDVVASVDGESAEVEDGVNVLRLSLKRAIPKSSWIVARAEADSSDMYLPPQLCAHTNPVYCRIDDIPQRSPDDARFFVQEIDGLLDWVADKGIFREPGRREEVQELFTSGRRKFEEMIP